MPIGLDLRQAVLDHLLQLVEEGALEPLPESETMIALDEDDVVFIEENLNG